MPIIGCDCEVCTSSDSRDSRLRTSIYIELADGNNGILVDSGPDLRTQALRAGFTRVDAVLYTHSHADHIFGLDDLRMFNFINKMDIPVYADSFCIKELRATFRYCFSPETPPAGSPSPQLELHDLTPYQAINILGVDIIPLPVMHGPIQIMAYRIGNFAYVTDCSLIPDKTREMLQGLDTLVINGLRHRSHPTHFTIEQAVEEIEQLSPQRAFLTHIAHEVGHVEGNKRIAELTDANVELAYDGLVLEI